MHVKFQEYSSSSSSLISKQRKKLQRVVYSKASMKTLQGLNALPRATNNNGEELAMIKILMASRPTKIH